MSDINQPALLIDAYSQIFRVFYAIAHLSRKDGFPTNALLGFGRLLMQLEKEFKPEHGALFFDCGKPAFRLELAPDYKSNRPPMPEDLKKQMPILREMAEAFGWNIHSCENFEADDLIGAAVKNQPENNFAIISSDKDLSQLINDKVAMLIPAKTGGFEKRDAAKTVEKFSVRPDQMVDYLAMLGDASDVIPGVAGVGPKTAASVLAQFDSLADFFAAPEELSNVKLRTKLLEAREQLLRNQKLITLKTQWPEALGNVSEALAKKTPDWTQIAKLCQLYELKSLLKELPPEAVAAASMPREDAAGETETDDLFSWHAPEVKSAKENPAADDLFADWDFNADR